MHPALGLLEMTSITAGIRCGDAMVKRSPVELLHAGTVHPGKYLVLVAGEVAHVEEALDAGRQTAADILDQVFLPGVHPRIFSALSGQRENGAVEALGIFETRTVSTLLRATDAALKEADIVLRSLHIADDLGGKAYGLFSGSLTDTEAAITAAQTAADPARVLSSAVIPQLHEEMLANLEALGTFLPFSRRGKD